MGSGLVDYVDGSENCRKQICSLDHLEKWRANIDEILTWEPKITHIDIEKEHEKVMRHVEQDPTSQMYQDREEKVKKTHLKEKEMHAEQSQVHQTLKAQHLKTISMINMLHKEVK